MHVLDDTGLFKAYTPVKENDGKASTMLKFKRLILLSFLLGTLFLSMFCIIQGGAKGIMKIKHNLRDQKLKRGQKVAKINGGDSESGSERKSRLTASLENTTEKKKEKKVISEEGKRIQFIISNIDGEPNKEGKITIQTHPSWGPRGVEQLVKLTESSFFDGCRFFRVVENFVVQWGINGDPSIQKKWNQKKPLKDEPVKTSNARGTVTFATSGKDTRSTQLFINTGKKNAFLDSQGFSPVGEVIEGMDLVDRLYGEYGESPDQWQIETKGNAYLKKEFPKLSFIKKASIITSDSLS